MHQVWQRFNKKLLARLRRKKPNSIPEAKPHHSEAVGSKNCTFIMSTFPDGDPNIHHHVHCIRHIQVKICCANSSIFCCYQA